MDKEDSLTGQAGRPQAHSEPIEPDSLSHLNDVYDKRFDAAEVETKDAIWKEITRYLQRFVPPGGATLDIACDHGDFIRNIQSADKWATDIRDVRHELPADVHFVQGDGLLLEHALPAGHFDVVFMSNYLEHLPTGHAVIEQFRVAHALLKPGGRAIVLQPNIRLIGSSYWNFIDHRTALTEKSLAEAAELSGLKTDRVITRFLPFTTKSRLPQHPRLVRAYLSFRPAWLVLGKQTLYMARRL